MAEICGLFDERTEALEYGEFSWATLCSMLTGGQGYLVGVGDEFALTNGGGWNVLVGTGAAWIGDPAGWWYINDTAKSLSILPAADGTERIDYVVIRLERGDEVAAVTTQVIQGNELASDPQPPTIEQGTMIYDLVLAKIHVVGNTSMTIIDERDGDLGKSIMAIGRNFKHSQGGLYFRGTVGGVLQPWKRIDSGNIEQTDSSWTLGIAHMNCVVRVNNAVATTITVPHSDTISFPAGIDITLVQFGAGAFTLVTAANVTIYSEDGNLTSDGQYTVITLRYLGNNEWLAIGRLTT